MYRSGLLPFGSACWFDTNTTSALPIHTRLGLSVASSPLFPEQNRLAQRFAHPHADRKNPMHRSALARLSFDTTPHDRPHRRDNSRSTVLGSAANAAFATVNGAISAVTSPSHRPAPRPSRPTLPASLRGSRSRPCLGVQGFLFAALDNRGVLIHRSDLLLRTSFSQSLDQNLVHFS